MIKQLNFTPPPAEQNTAVALGFFDGLHLGHQQVIGRAVREPDLLPAVFTFRPDESTPFAKRSGLLSREWQKQAWLGQMGVRLLWSPPFQDFSHLTPEAFVRQVLVRGLKAKLVCCGYNYTFGKGGSAGPEVLSALCEQEGIRCEVLPAMEYAEGPVSSSRIRQAIAQGEMELAAGLLGRPFTLEEVVVHGRQLGRLLHFPTINQPIPEEMVQPRFGVYASETVVDGVRYRSITNVGRKPTVGSDCVLAETHLLDFDGDLYNKRLPVSLLRFLRPEQKFGSVEELQKQVLRDLLTRREMSL